ncbi:hypothetical protein ILUMI_00375 [Ignelater luminosus]|uniref:Uncharacterized protein n=1 Tax=Ignelater luminosus TaxID=2038154 RepID=A0A8K0DLR6_IGNLU|nr:hypothetical protein ILUMI_00375 [Ignelater luminosus]
MDAEIVNEHINSFSRVESHYCCGDSNREYLEGNFSAVKMYALYAEQMNTQDLPPVKLSQYRYIFCNNFNIYFHKPKKDHGNVCELNKLQTAEEDKLNTDHEYLKHIKAKEEAREGNNDRETGTPVVSFDLQNVLTCLKAEFSSFYYKSKMSVYNLTAHLLVNNQVYCCIWPEVLMGRQGNDIASALIRILKEIVKDHAEIKELTLWS